MIGADASDAYAEAYAALDSAEALGTLGHRASTPGARCHRGLAGFRDCW